ncbi:MAG: hypothetical protein QM538_00550 [Methylacidiphilales bacterium]|nr:hypothetical protein [Candidatus Methylacidiphilales bacterium]
MILTSIKAPLPLFMIICLSNIALIVLLTYLMNPYFIILGFVLFLATVIEFLEIKRNMPRYLSLSVLNDELYIHKKTINDFIPYKITNIESIYSWVLKIKLINQITGKQKIISIYTYQISKDFYHLFTLKKIGLN